MRAKFILSVALAVAASMGTVVASSADPLQDAKSAFDRLDYAASRRIWQLLADQGNAEAQTRLDLTAEGKPRPKPGFFHRLFGGKNNDEQG